MEYIKYFCRYEALFGFAGSAVISFFFWIIPGGTQVDVKWIFLICLIGFLIIWGLLIALSKTCEVHPIIKVVQVDERENRLLFKTNFMSMMVIGGSLSVYVVENGFERLCGFITISNIQDKYVQGDLIINNSTNIETLKRENIKIKPMINLYAIESLQNRGTDDNA